MPVAFLFSSFFGLPFDASAEEPASRAVALHIPSGPLAGLIVYLSAGHGRLLHRTADGRPLAWSWQRDPRYGVREDEWTGDFVVEDLAGRLEQAGATVVTLRERDPRSVGFLVDDADAGFAVEGSGGWAGADQAWGPGWRDLEDTARATWSFTAPGSGVWRVYARWVSSPDRSAEARYTVRSPTRDEVWTIDQRRHGGIWWPIGTVELAEGQNAEVLLDGAGGRLSADAVRIGGGSWAPGPGYEVAPLAEIAPIHRQSSLGGPASLLWLDDGSESSDIRFRARWATWASPTPEEAIFLSIHTNAGRGRGSEIYAGVERDPPLDPQPGSLSLAGAIVEALPAHLRLVAPGWPVDAVRLGDFSEVSPRWQHLPSALIEVGFHDHPTDARFLRDPAFRGAYAEALVDAVARWRMGSAVIPDAFRPVVPGHPPGDRLP